MIVGESRTGRSGLMAQIRANRPRVNLGHQNLMITALTIATISNVGTSFIIR